MTGGRGGGGGEEEEANVLESPINGTCMFITEGESATYKPNNTECLMMITTAESTWNRLTRSPSRC